MTWTSRVLALGSIIWTLSGCGSASQRCRVGAAFQTDPVLREIALSRCEHVEDREYAESVRLDEHDRTDAEQRRQEQLQERRDQQAARSERDQAYRAIHEAPRAPELGATAKESASVCKQQQGRQFESTVGGRRVLRCFVGDVAIYKALVSTSSDALIDVRVFYEGGDLAELRGLIEEQRGAATRTGVKDGFRFWLWESDREQIVVTSYDKGVAVSSGIIDDRDGAFTDKEAHPDAETRLSSQETKSEAPITKCSIARMCPTGLRCDFGKGICVPAKSTATAPESSPGSSEPECSLARSCPSGSQCNFGTGKCTR